jgi:hypothetical protein
MKRFVGLLLGCLGITAHLHAGDITVHCQAQVGQRDVRLASGTLVPNGNEVRIGYFDNGFDVAVNASNLTALEGAWNEFGQTSIRTLSGQMGLFSGTLSGEAGTFTDKPIYLWILKTFTNGSVAQDLGNVEAYGLYSSDSTEWTFPLDSAPPPGNSVTIVSDHVNVLYGVGSVDDSSLILAAALSANQNSYLQWAAGVFKTSTPVASRDPEDNPDGDDLNNGLEYLIGSHPEFPTESPIDSQLLGNSLRVTYPRSNAVPTGTEYIEVSGDLKLWIKDPSLDITMTYLNALQSLVTVTLPLDNLKHRFLQIVVDVNGQMK